MIDGPFLVRAFPANFKYIAFLKSTVLLRSSNELGSSRPPIEELTRSLGLSDRSQKSSKGSSFWRRPRLPPRRRLPARLPRQGRQR